MSQKIITRTEFEKHHYVGDCWIEINGNVYDVSQWMKKHPGGERLQECLGGKDASLPFLLNHKPEVGRKYLPTMYIGELEAKSKKNKYDALTKDFITLYNLLMSNGWFETSYAYYSKKILILIAMLCGVLYLFELANYYNFELFAIIGSFMVGMFWQQVAFIGHDVGHNALTHSVFLDSCVGLIIGNLGQGISIGWWKYTHNVHHVRTNDGAWDPDIQHMPVIAISKKYLSDLYSYFHRRKLPPTDTISWFVSKIAIKYQHYHWFFTLMFSRIFLYLSSFIFVFVQQPKHQNGSNEAWKYYFLLEQISLVGYHVWTLGLFFLCTNHPILYYLIAYVTAGILHVQIILNHFPCPIFYDIADENFIVHQLKSSMAIKSNVLTHWFFGGLQFQVEHHLFPMMPRHNLRKVKPYILELCKKYELPYLENSFWGAIYDISGILKDVAKHADKLNSINFTMHVN